MARTGLFGGFYFDEEVFTDLMTEADYWSNPILASGIVRQDDSIMNLIGDKGNVATIPMYKPISIYDSNMAPVEIAGDKQTCMLIQRMKAFKAKDFTKELTGADPLTHIKNSIQKYYTQVWEDELMNIAKGVLGVSALASHVTDLSIKSGTIAAANKISETTLIDAEQEALGRRPWPDCYAFRYLCGISEAGSD